MSQTCVNYSTSTCARVSGSKKVPQALLCTNKSARTLLSEKGGCQAARVGKVNQVAPLCTDWLCLHVHTMTNITCAAGGGFFPRVLPDTCGLPQVYVHHLNVVLNIAWPARDLSKLFAKGERKHS